MSMDHELDAALDEGAPVWASFGDLMAVLLGVFVLILAGVIGVQLHLETRLKDEIRQREQAEQRRQALEQALAAPLAGGRITLVDGRIGIRGSVLFPRNSDRLSEEGGKVLAELAGPLKEYLQARGEILMVSGFTDDRPIHEDNALYRDNWELSAKRALTVTRALIDAGVPGSQVFAAAFGAEHPVASNADEKGRAQNRRVEIAPMPRPGQGQEGR